MGQKLLDFYDQAQQIGGLKARLRLAILTKIPSTKAKTEPDTPENINKFVEALSEIKKEFKS